MEKSANLKDAERELQKTFEKEKRRRLHRAHRAVERFDLILGKTSGNRRFFYALFSKNFLKE